MKLEEIIQHNTTLLHRSEHPSPNAADLYYHDLAESTLRELEKLQKLERIVSGLTKSHIIYYWRDLFSRPYEDFVEILGRQYISWKDTFIPTKEEYEEIQKLIKELK